MLGTGLNECSRDEGLSVAGVEGAWGPTSEMTVSGHAGLRGSFEGIWLLC